MLQTDWGKELFTEDYQATLCLVFRRSSFSHEIQLSQEIGSDQLQHTIRRTLIYELEAGRLCCLMLLLLFEKKFTPGCKNWHPSTKSAWARQNHDKPRDCFNRSSLSTIWSSSSNGQKECVSRVTIYLSSNYLLLLWRIYIINPQSSPTRYTRVGTNQVWTCILVS